MPQDMVDQPPQCQVGPQSSYRREPNHRGGWRARETAVGRIQEPARVLLQLKGLLDCHWSLFTRVAVHGRLDGYVCVRTVSFDHRKGRLPRRWTAGSQKEERAEACCALYFSRRPTSP